MQRRCWHTRLHRLMTDLPDQRPPWKSVTLQQVALLTLERFVALIACRPLVALPARSHYQPYSTATTSRWRANKDGGGQLNIQSLHVWSPNPTLPRNVWNVKSADVQVHDPWPVQVPGRTCQFLA